MNAECDDELATLLETPLASLRPRQAFLAARRLGLLASWLLRPEVLRKAADYAADDETWSDIVAPWRGIPPLPQGLGACWVVAVHEQRRQRPLLRDAAVLPLRWARDQQSHHPRLPADLRRVADQVVDVLARHDEVTAADAWKLFPASDGLLDGPGQPCLEGKYPSAWAPLAAGLLLAAGHGKPDPTVWATGAWDLEHGIQPIDGLKQKLAIAADEFGAKTFYVPEQNLGDAKRVSLGIDVRAIAVATRRPPSPRDALRDYLVRFRLRPTSRPPEELGERVQWEKECSAYFLSRPDEGEARAFYFDTILPEVRRSLSAKSPVPQVTRLATIVSKGYWLVDLALGLVRPLHFQPGDPLMEVLLLHDAEMESTAKDIQSRINAQSEMHHSKATCYKFKGATFAALNEEFRDCLRGFCGGAPYQLAIDLTAGRRNLNLALHAAAPRGCHVFVCQGDFDRESGRPKPFTEDVDSWNVGDHSG